MSNMEKMLETASRKLGTSPQALRKSLGKGDLHSVMSKMDKSDAEKLEKTLSGFDEGVNIVDKDRLTDKNR